MRVGFITGEYPPMEGGVGAFTRELARALVAEGHTVSVFARRRAEAVEEDGISIAPIVSKRWDWSAVRLAQAWASNQSLDMVNIQFQTAAYDMHPAAHWLPTSLKNSRSKSVVTFHDLRAPYLFPKAGPIRSWIVRKLALDADGIIATDHKDAIALKAWGAPNVAWIPIGSNISVDLNAQHDRAAARQQLGISPNQLLVSYFGFLNESKGGLLLIDAVSEIVNNGIDVHLLMIGGRAGASDPTNEAYGRQVDARIEHHGLQTRVHWSGFVSDREVSELFYASDITALPYLDGASLRRGTLMAALAHGRAIVTTNFESPLAELEGVVHTVHADSRALATGITELWNTKRLRASLEHAATKAARAFQWDNIARQTISFYESLLSYD